MGKRRTSPASAPAQPLAGPAAAGRLLDEHDLIPPHGRSQQLRNANHGLELKWVLALTTYIVYMVLIVFGHLRDALDKITGRSRYSSMEARPSPVCS
jgi:hypothetical protein